MDNKTKGLLLLALSALLYSIMPVLIRVIVSNGMPPATQLFFRYIFAFFFALIYFFGISQTSFSFPRKHLPLLIVTSLFGYAIGTLFFTFAILNTQVSNTLFLFYSFAIITPILGVIFLKEKINKFNVLALIIGLVSLLLLFQPNSFNTWEIGGIFAILASFAQSMYIIGIKKLHGYASKYLMLINTSIGVLSLGIISFVLEHKFYSTNQLLHLSLNTWILTIFYGLINFLAWLFLTKGFEYFKASTGSIILLLELLFGVTFAFFFFHEIPTVATFIGGVLIALASVLVIVKGKN